MYLVLTVELDGPPDERASDTLTQLVDRCAAEAGGQFRGSADCAGT